MNQIINKGDRLLCKNKLTVGMFTYYHKNRYYIVGQVGKYIHNDYSYYVSDDIDTIYPFAFNYGELLTHFYTSKEVRRMKLKRLKVIYEEAEY